MRQICLISHHNAAELLGALLFQERGVRIHAIVTPEMADRGTNFLNACQMADIPCELHTLAKIGFPEMTAVLESVNAAAPGEEWALNITGGTKIMALAAHSWALANDIPIFYIDTANRAVHLHGQDGWEESPLPDLLDYGHLLDLYGFEVIEEADVEFSPAADATLGEIAQFLTTPMAAPALHILNACAGKASAHANLSVPYTPSKSMKKLLAICKKAGKLDYGNGLIRFGDEMARQWCNGFWLEEYVASIMARLMEEGRITSCASGVKIEGHGIKNELDGIFTANNCLYIIECKTSRMEKDTTTFYKADSLRERIAGTLTKSMVCAIDPPGPWERQRAEQMHLKTVTGPELENLYNIISKWIEE